MRSPLLLCASIALVACSSSSSDDASPAEPPPPIPAGLLRDPEDWIFLPRPGRDEACAPGTPCARAVENVLAWAGRWQDAAIFPDLTESLANDNDHDVVTLACALAWRASEDDAWRERARGLLGQAVVAPYVPGGSALRPGRNLLSYVLAASTIDLADLDPDLDGNFRAWIEQVAEIDRWQGDGVDSPGTFRDYQRQRPNNLGLIVGAARVAVDMYLGGETHGRHLLEARDILRRFLGDGGPFVYPAGAFGGALNDNSWQSVVEPERFVGVNPVGARLPSPGGFDVDGCLPEEMRRLVDPDCASCGRVPSVLCYNAADSIDLGSPQGIAATGYPWEALQGLVMQAYLLQRCGYQTFLWGDAAIERAHRFLFVTYGLRAQDTWSDPSQSDDAACCNGASARTQVDDTWVPHVVEALLDPAYLDESSLVYGGRPGKNCGFADWWTLGLRGTGASSIDTRTPPAGGSQADGENTIVPKPAPRHPAGGRRPAHAAAGGGPRRPRDAPPPDGARGRAPHLPPRRPAAEAHRHRGPGVARDHRVKRASAAA